MHTDQPYFPKNPMQASLDNQMGYYIKNSQMALSVLNGVVPPSIKRPISLHNIDIQPSNACPRNFLIFDQTNYRSQIMFHPEISSKLFSPTFDVNPSLLHDINVLQNDVNPNCVKETEPLMEEEEDYDDIELLLSSEYEENDEPEDDEVSTARTGAYYECGSPDSCSNYEPSPKKKRLFLEESAGVVGIEENKNKRIRKMVEALRGMVPGANQMTTVSVLDESVRYLKSLRVEVQKLGISDFGG